MRAVAIICIIVGAASLVMGIVARLMATTAWLGLTSRAFSGFSTSILLLAVALLLLKK